jgi:glycosyltransferase involved in cell wall biosynthesis
VTVHLHDSDAGPPRPALRLPNATPRLWAGGPPRLVLVSESIYPDVVGGLEIQAHDVAQRLTAAGVPVTVLTRRATADAAGRGWLGAVPVVRIDPHGHLKGLGWRAVVPLLRYVVGVTLWLLVYRHSYDVILAHGVKVLTLPVLIAQWFGNRPCIVKVDSPIELWEEISGESLRRMGVRRNAGALRFLRGIRSALLRRVGQYVAISEEIRDALVNEGVPPERIRCIPNGIDVARFHPVTPAERRVLRRKLGLPLDAVVVNFTGRFSAAKGLMMLAGLWKQIVAEGRPVHLVLVGDGEQSFDTCEAELRDFMAANGLGQTVTFTGMVGNVAEYLQASDLFVFPSEYEGLPLALLEAMACGLPVASTRVGAAREFLVDREHGALAEPGDEAQMRAALRWLLDHPERWSEMGRAGRGVVCARFSLAVVAEEYRTLVRDVSKRGRRR